MNKRRILLISREPIVHQLGGSTTYALSLLSLLRAHGCDVTVLVTDARSRSPRLWFRQRAKLPEGVRLLVPETWRVGPWWIRPLSWRAWMRALLRTSARVPAFSRLRRRGEALCGDRVTGVAWDLTAPTAGERALALRYVARVNALTVIGNYAFWGELFDAPSLRTLRCCLLMHDLLSERVQRFCEGNLPLDCPPLTRDEEFRWLAAADCLLAAQASEADAVRPFVDTAVVVTPMVLTAKRTAEAGVPGRVLFLGSNILPNRTGLRWLLEEVWPRVRAQRPGATLVIAGTVSAAVEDRAAAGRQGVEVLGMVDCVATEYARAQVVVVPLLVGSGLKIKLVEALAYGRATVSTSTGVQGLEAWAGDAVAIADDPAEFAAAVVRLLADDRARGVIEGRSLELAEAHFGPSQPLPEEFLRCVLG